MNSVYPLAGGISSQGAKKCKIANILLKFFNKHQGDFNPVTKSVEDLGKRDNVCFLHMKKYKNTKKYWFCVSSKFPTNNCSADLLLGDSKLNFFNEALLCS